MSETEQREYTQEERYSMIKNGVIDQNTGELCHPCPECGEDVEKTTLGAALAARGLELEDGDNPDAIAFRCSNHNRVENPCPYVISIGEVDDAAAQ